MLQIRTRYQRDTALQVAHSLSLELAEYVDKLAIAGSIRREVDKVGDIELLVIPKMQCDIVDMMDRQLRQMIANGKLAYRLNKIGAKTYGPYNKLLIHVGSGIPVDVFSTCHGNWYTSLVVRTGGTENNRMIAAEAIKRGLRFLAYGPGFSRADGSVIQCESERQVYETVGLDYREPDERV